VSPYLWTPGTNGLKIYTTEVEIRAYKAVLPVPSYKGQHFAKNPELLSFFVETINVHFFNSKKYMSEQTNKRNSPPH